MAETLIQWCMYTLNWWLGCRKVAPECENCYITRTPALRFRGMKHGDQRQRTKTPPKNVLTWNNKALAAERIFSSAMDDWKDAPDHVPAPSRPERPRVFVGSLMDWADKEVSDEWRDELFDRALIPCKALDFLLLTKRPENAVKYFLEYCRRRAIAMPVPNLWFGVSAGVDTAKILEIPAVVHFLSAEPLLKAPSINPAFDWVILGGESRDGEGSPCRECALEWIDDGLDKCERYGIPAFVKQYGSLPTLDGSRIILKDGHGGEMAEWEERHRIRKFPTPRYDGSFIKTV